MKKLLLATIFVLTSIFTFTQSTYTQSFTTTGTSYWICPSGVTSITVECFGAGGGGGGAAATATSNTTRGGGGAGGGYVKRTSYTVTPGTSYTIYVGNGGSAGSTAGGNGGEGETSYFINSSTIAAVGGNGGNGGTAASGTCNGTGGVKKTTGNVGNDVSFSFYGGSGGSASGSYNAGSASGNSGGSGASAGTGSDGGNASGSTAGSAVTGGVAGVAGRTTDNNGLIGNSGGSGGSGGFNYSSATPNSGGAGGSGKVIISYTACVPLFEQDFNSSTTVSDYVNSTPNHSQITSITAAQTINTTTSNKLRMDNSASSFPYFSRVTDFVGSPTNVIVKFDVTFSALTSYSNASTYLYIGTGFTDGTVPSSSFAHSRLCFATQSANPTNQFAVRNVDPGATASNSGFYTGKQSITWVINNSGGSLSYLAPDGTTESVADDKEDIWVGTTKVWNDVGCWGSTNSLTDFYFKWTNGAGIMDIDNITINPIVSSSPTSSAGSSINCSSFSSNWTTSSCNASLEVATNNTFTSMVSGYPLSVTSSPYSVTGLSAGTSYYYRLRTSMGSNSNAITSSYSTTQTITTTASSVGGSVASDQNVVSGGSAATVNLSGHTGSVVKWQRDVILDFSTATDVSNTTTSVTGASMGAITQTVYYRAVVQNGTCATANSAYVKITMVASLPIELLYFNGVVCETGNRLYWSSSSENNNDYFNIEKTRDGIDWNSIVTIEGAGNSNNQLYYSFVDEDVESIINYYRLKQTDYDGKFKYSDIISIDNRTNKVKEIDKITNILGQEVDLQYYRGLVIIYYTDGSSQKMIK